MAERVVVWTETARTDLEMLLDQTFAARAGDAFGELDRIERCAASLTQREGRGRVVPELRALGILHFHEVIESPWRLIYRVEPERVMVMAVLDARRELEDVLLERLTR